MKKLFLLLLSGAAASAFAGPGVPTSTPKAMLTKASATWCNPCGTWGWNLANTMIADRVSTGKAFYVGVFPDGASNWGTVDFQSPVSIKWKNDGLVTTGGYPSFGVNLIDHSGPNTDPSAGTVNTGAVKTDCYAAIDAFTAAAAAAGVSFEYKISGNDVTVESRVKFFAASSGEYNVGVFLLEDKALHSQNGQSTQTTTTEHHSVLRTSMSTNYGDQIASGSITAGQEYTKTFTFTVTDTKWDKTKFKPVAVIWKKNGSKYDYVNGNDVYSYATSVATVATNVSDINVYPNPASSATTVAMNLASASDLNIYVTDVAGRVVYNAGNIHFAAGQAQYSISTANFTAGTYHITVKSGDNVITKQISVAK